MNTVPYMWDRLRLVIIRAGIAPLIITIAGVVLGATHTSAQEVLRVYTGVGEETEAPSASCEERREVLFLGDQARRLNDGQDSERRALWIAAVSDALVDEVLSDDPYFQSGVAFTLCSAVDLATGATVEFWQQGMILEDGEVWATCSVGSICRAGTLAFVALRELSDGTPVAVSPLEDISALASCMIDGGGEQ